MSKHKESDGNPDETIQLNSADRSALDKASESPTEHELFKNFDEDRRSFLKKLLISAAYVTPAILSFSIRDAEAGKRRRKRPTRKEKKQGRKKKQKKQKKPWEF